MQSHVPISHSPPAPTPFALLAAGQLKTNRQPIPECALYLQSIAAKGDSMDRDRTRDRLTSGATEETMAVSYGIIGGIVLFGIAGYLLDTWLRTSPWLLILGLVVGVAAGLFGLSRLIRERRSTRET